MTMDSSKQQGGAISVDGVFTRPMSAVELGLICTAIVLAVGIVDLITANINLAILYALPVIIAAQSRRKSLVSLMAISAIALTYAGYFIGPRAEHYATLADLLVSYRLLNRTLCVAALLAIAAATFLYMNVHSRLAGLHADMVDPSADRELHCEVLRFYERLTAMSACVVLVIWVAIMDFLVPQQFNLSILYVIPLASMTWVRSRALLWTMFAILLICTFVGYVLSFPLRPEDALLSPFLLRNRFLAALALFGCTMLLQFATSPRDDSPANDAPVDQLCGSASSHA